MSARAGFDGVLDVPDDPMPQYAHCSRCKAALEPEDDADCGEPGCPVEANQSSIDEMRRR